MSLSFIIFTQVNKSKLILPTGTKVTSLFYTDELAYITNQYHKIKEGAQ